MRVAIVGGGIRGCGVAAMLAQMPDFEVSLLERGKIASGITHTNHGRLHGGTEGWAGGNIQEMISRRKGMEYLLLMNAATNQVPSSQLIQTDVNEAAYLNACRAAGINVTRAQIDDHLTQWIQPSDYQAAYTVAEFAFDPAEISKRLAEAYSHLSGLQPIEQAQVQTINVPENDDCSIVLRSGDVLGPFDIVVCAVAGWRNIQIRPETSSVPMNLRYPGNRLLYLDRRAVEDMPELNRVICIMDRDGSIPSAIPHGNTIVFGCDVGLTGSTSETDQGQHDHQEASQFRPGDDNFRQLEVLQRYFPRLAQTNTRRQLRSFRGVYPRIAGQNRNFELKRGSDKFFVCYGGNATTSLVDAYETLRVLCESMDIGIDDEDTVIRRLIRTVLTSPQLPLQFERMAYFR